MKTLLTNEEIVKICDTIGEELTKKFAGREPIVACVLKGACEFHAELIKHIKLPIRIDYIQASSYSGTQTTGSVAIKKDLDFDIEGQDLIVVEDIVDTGTTLNALKPIFEKRKPKSLTFVCLLDKPARRKVPFKPDYVGKTIDDLFVVGFGLDLNEEFRNLKDIVLYDKNENYYV